MNDLVKINPLAPTNFNEAEKFANMIAKSDMAPKHFRNKPADILIAMQMGYEVGINPLQAIQNIAVINGRPCLWGDTLLAIVQRSPQFEYIKESDDGEVATCIVKRKGGEEHIVTFSMEDAKKAGLLSRQGPWQQYPKRMRQMRARGFALRDQFADALAGFSSAEEVQDYDIVEEKEKPIKKKKEAIEGEFISKIPPTDIGKEIDFFKSELESANSIQILKIKWDATPPEFKKELELTKEQMKMKLTAAKVFDEPKTESPFSEVEIVVDSSVPDDGFPA